MLILRSVGNRQFPELRRDNHLSQDSGKSKQYGNQCGDAPVTAECQVGTRQYEHGYGSRLAKNSSFSPSSLARRIFM
jgi:hypothetical protein